LHGGDLDQAVAECGDRTMSGGIVVPDDRHVEGPPIVEPFEVGPHQCDLGKRGRAAEAPAQNCGLQYSVAV
jgi:hypothetical protein